MKSLADKYYVEQQYNSTNRLEARIELHQRFSTNKQGWMAWVFEKLLPLAKGDILEVGGGTAALWQENEDKLKNEWTLTFSDRSHAMVQKARQNRALQRMKSTFLQTDVQCLPLANESFDLLIANHMFYHLPDLEKGLSEIKRVLRPGGILFATTVGKDNTRELKEMMSQFSNYICEEAAPSFNLENGHAKLAEHFENVQRIDYVDSFAITETEPLVLYAQSIVEDLAVLDFRQYVSSLLDEYGVINIGKSSGLYIARRAR